MRTASGATAVLVIAVWLTPGCLFALVCGPDDIHSLVFRDEGLFDELSAKEGHSGPYEVGISGAFRPHYQLETVERALDHHNHSWVRLEWGPLPAWPVHEPIRVEAVSGHRVEFVFEDYGKMEPAALKPVALELLRNITNNETETTIDRWADEFAHARITNSTIRSLVLRIRPDIEPFVAELEQGMPLKLSATDDVGLARFEADDYTLDFAIPVLSADPIAVDTLDRASFTWFEKRNRVPMDEMEAHLADAYANLSIGEPPTTEKRYVTTHSGC